MRKAKTLQTTAILCLIMAGCGDDDSGSVDPDAATPTADAGERDAGSADAGLPDAGPPDAAPPDAGPPDAGPAPTPCELAMLGSFTFETLDLDAGSVQSINDSGQLVVVAAGPGGNGTVLLNADLSVERTLVEASADNPDGTTTARGLSNDGTVVGYYSPNFGAFSEVYGFWWEAGEAAPQTVDYFAANGIDTSGWGFVDQAVTGINEAGTLIGYFWEELPEEEGASGYRGFMQEAGSTPEQLDLPGMGFVFPWAINREGVVVGRARRTLGDATINYAYERQPDGDLYMYRVFGATTSSAAGINNEGVVAGYYQDPSTDALPFAERVRWGYLAHDDELVRLQYPDSSATQPSDINNDCVVVGSYTDDVGDGFSFRATPNATEM